MDSYSQFDTPSVAGDFAINHIFTRRCQVIMITQLWIFDISEMLSVLGSKVLGSKVLALEFQVPARA